MTHVINILVDGWKKPRGKVSVKHAEILVALCMAGWDLKKRNEQIDIKI